MPTVHLPYVDSALAHMEVGGPAAFWHNLHWGLYRDPASADDSPEGYVVAAAALTEHVVAAAGVTPGTQVLDVGCGFGGTLAHIHDRHPGCRLAGMNIDERQLRWARRLGEGPPLPLAAADGCRCRWRRPARTTCWRWSACSTSRAARRSSGRRPGCWVRAARWR